MSACTAIAGLPAATLAAASRSASKSRLAASHRPDALVTTCVGGDSNLGKSAVGRRAMLSAASVSLLCGRGAGAAWAGKEEKTDYSNYNSGSGPDDSQSDLVKRLRAKSAENKVKNDADRFNYDTQYAANLAIIKGTGYVPEDQATRDRIGVSRPGECNLPIFKDSPTCKAFE
mmetsp:Transcript_10152/g.24989  ORF Transcript_10152/g.24989 Transcript_10152/m.24989 type:complete len:173 (-) Transcript_10152:30-548(-)